MGIVCPMKPESVLCAVPKKAGMRTDATDAVPRCLALTKSALNAEQESCRIPTEWQIWQDRGTQKI